MVSTRVDRYRATLDCMSGLVAGAGKVTTADQVAIYLDMVEWVGEKGHHCSRGKWTDWEVFASLETDLDLLSSDQKVWLLISCAVAQVWAADSSQFIDVPIMPCKWMLDCICTQDICEKFWIMCRKPDSGCLSHMPNKDFRVTVLGPFPLMSALPFLCCTFWILALGAPQQLNHKSH